MLELQAETDDARRADPSSLADLHEGRHRRSGLRQGECAEEQLAGCESGRFGLRRADRDPADREVDEPHRHRPGVQRAGEPLGPQRRVDDEVDLLVDRAHAKVLPALIVDHRFRPPNRRSDDLLLRVELHHAAGFHDRRIEAVAHVVDREVRPNRAIDRPGRRGSITPPRSGHVQRLAVRADQAGTGHLQAAARSLCVQFELHVACAREIDRRVAR